MSNFTLNDWLDHAIQREAYARDYYTKAIDIVGTDDAKAALKRLADEETGHKSRLEAIKKKGDFANLGKGLKEPGADFAGDRAFTPVKADSTPKELVNIAILNEENARLFYQWFEEVYLGTELEEFFRKLALEEKRHAEILTELEATF